MSGAHAPMSPLTIEHLAHSDGLDLVLTGELDRPAAASVRRIVNVGLASGITSIDLDVSAISFVDGGGLALISYLAHRTTERGGRLVLRGTTPRWHRLLAITGDIRGIEYAEVRPRRLAAGARATAVSQVIDLRRFEATPLV